VLTLSFLFSLLFLTTEFFTQAARLSNPSTTLSHQDPLEAEAVLADTKQKHKINISKYFFIFYFYFLTINSIHKKQIIVNEKMPKTILSFWAFRY
jgi:hypothetical protein